MRLVHMLISAAALAMVVGVSTIQKAHADALPDLYFVDAHSQLPGGLDVEDIIPLMDQAGVKRTILSARNDRAPQDVADFAEAHAGRITAAVRSKGKSFGENSPKFKKLIKEQTDLPVFQAMAEVLLFHAQKGAKAPKIEASPDDPQVQLLLKIALKHNWPFITHYEFAAAGWDKSDLMNDFEALVKANPEHPFMLIHMGQLNVEEATRLLSTYSNVYFMTSHSNPISKAENPGQPWINMFEGERLASKWGDLMTAHPDRFVLTFDNVWPEHWGNFYLDEAALWRKALAELPPEVAHAIAHGNAERLWNLPLY